VTVYTRHVLNVEPLERKLIKIYLSSCTLLLTAALCFRLRFHSTDFPFTPRNRSNMGMKMCFISKMAVFWVVAPRILVEVFFSCAISGILTVDTAH
jgi:hypothetical protein